MKFTLQVCNQKFPTHLKEILDAAAIDLTAEEVHAITQLVPEDTEVPK